MPRIFQLRPIIRSGTVKLPNSGISVLLLSYFHQTDQDLEFGEPQHAPSRSKQFASRGNLEKRHSFRCPEVSVPSNDSSLIVPIILRPLGVSLIGLELDHP